MNFVAIDFETANEKRHSPCSLGITVVKNSEIILEKYWMIKPPELRFAPINIGIHGIRPNDVIDADEFHTLWPELLPYLEGQLVVAHNASFDISVIRNTLDYYNLPYPTFDYCCTMVMSKRFYDYLPNAKLNTVSNHLGHTFSHHHASADATACAHVLLSIAKELQTTDITELSKQVGVKLGKVFERGYTPASSKGSYVSSSREHTSPTPQKLAPCPDTTYFKDKYIAFTGPLGRLSRSEAINLAEDLGATYTPSITRKTNLVVTNTKNPHKLLPEQMSTKLRRAMLLLEYGQAITIIDEPTFLKHLSL